MCHSANGAILSGEFINTLLISAAEEVEAFRRGQPDYRAFEEQRTHWNDTLSGLDESVLREYDGAVHRAFIDYQEILENYFIVKGLTEVIGRRTRGAAEPGESAAIPGLAQAEQRLRVVCRRFVERLDEKDGAQCAEYLRLRKRIVDTGRALCQRCGEELAEGLIKRSKLTCVPLNG